MNWERLSLCWAIFFPDFSKKQFLYWITAVWPLHDRTDYTFLDSDVCAPDQNEGVLYTANIFPL